MSQATQSTRTTPEQLAKLAAQAVRYPSAAAALTESLPRLLAERRDDIIGAALDQLADADKMAAAEDLLRWTRFGATTQPLDDTHTAHLLLLPILVTRDKPLKRKTCEMAALDKVAESLRTAGLVPDAARIYLRPDLFSMTDLLDASWSKVRQDLLLPTLRLMNGEPVEPFEHASKGGPERDGVQMYFLAGVVVTEDEDSCQLMADSSEAHFAWADQAGPLLAELLHFRAGDGQWVPPGVYYEALAFGFGAYQAVWLQLQMDAIEQDSGVRREDMQAYATTHDMGGFMETRLTLCDIETDDVLGYAVAEQLPPTLIDPEPTLQFTSATLAELGDASLADAWLDERLCPDCGKRLFPGEGESCCRDLAASAPASRVLH